MWEGWKEKRIVKALLHTSHTNSSHFTSWHDRWGWEREKDVNDWRGKVDMISEVRVTWQARLGDGMADEARVWQVRLDKSAPVNMTGEEVRWGYAAWEFYYNIVNTVICSWSHKYSTVVILIQWSSIFCTMANTDDLTWYFLPCLIFGLILGSLIWYSWNIYAHRSWKREYNSWRPTTHSCETFWPRVIEERKPSVPGRPKPPDHLISLSMY